MKIVDIALSQEGVKENQLNDILYNDWYYGRNVHGGSYPYCAVFVSWCANQAGLDTKIIPKTASVASLHRFFLDNNQFQSKETGYIPNPGDIMLQRSHSASHTGIVINSNAQEFVVMEGNTGEGVVRSSYSYTDPNLTGFGTPQYPEDIVVRKSMKLRTNVLTSDAPTEESTTSNYTAYNSRSASPQMTEEEIWDWFRYKGYSAEATAGIMGRMACESANYSPAYEPLRNSNGQEVGGMGMFQWTWDRGHLPEEPEPDLNIGRQRFPTSRLATYLNWCDANSRPYESCASQLDYLWEVDLYSQEHVLYTGYTFRPAEMNSLTIEQAARQWTDYYERGFPSNEESVGRELYAKYSSRPAPTSVPSSTGDLQGTLANASMRTANVSLPVGVGRYTYVTYTVKSGDTLESIASDFNITPQMIMFANSLKDWKVTAGQTLHIPKAEGILSHSDAISGVGELAQLLHTQSVTVSHPTATVHFFGEYGKLAAKSTLNPDKNENVYNDIISISTNRNMAQDCPNFVITLVWRNEWYDKLASNDMIIIWMQRPPEDNRVVMYGLIDDIRRTVDWSSTQPKRAVQVSGRGFNKAFCHFDIGIIDFYSGLEKGFGGFFNQLQHIQGRDSYGAIELTINAYLDKGQKYKFGNGKTLKDYFVYAGAHKLNERLIDYTSFTSFNGSMWNFIKELGNAPFNETYWEVINDKPTMIHRPTPFNKNDWIALNRITIKDENLVSNNTGRSDLETYTIYNCHISIMSESTANYYPPVWYPPFYPKYGLRELKVDTVYAISKIFYEPREYTRDLFNFNIKNNIFENGTLVVKGSNQYRVGERVILESEGTEFYVEAVSHSFNVYNNWITSLNVTRGINPDQRFTPPFGAAEDFTIEIMMALLQMTGDKTIDWYNLPEMQRNTTSQRQTGSYSGSNAGLYDFRGKDFTWPIQGHSYDREDITSPFGPRNTGIEGASTYHKGIDIAYSYTGGEPIIAACDGTVTYAGPSLGYGNYIEIDHGDGIMTGYAHMYDQDLLVQVGQKVSAGTHIANVGANGVGSGPHLHFEVLIEGERVDPETAFQERVNTPFSDVGVSASMEEVATSCYNYLTGQMGLNKCAACAVLGNIQQESGFNLIGENYDSGAFGLCQWLGDRRYAMESWCRQNGLEVTSVAGQMGYLNYELHGDESSSLSVLTGASDKREAVYSTAVAFGESFERYESNGEGSRGRYAIDWWDTFVRS